MGFYVAFNTVQVISRRVVGRAEGTSTYSWSRFCTVNCRSTESNYQMEEGVVKIDQELRGVKVKWTEAEVEAHLNPNHLQERTYDEHLFNRFRPSKH